MLEMIAYFVAILFVVLVGVLGFLFGLACHPMPSFDDRNDDGE